jgi:LmbE family N-acetylglucosaminyl deacetylase
MADIVLSLLAHPDDAEFFCAGTLLRLVRDHGWRAHVATMTAGDCGSVELSPEAISQVRRGEGKNAAALLGGIYHCLEERDLLISYTEPALEKVTRLFREVRPRIVLTHSPADYLLDHEMASMLARAAAFAAPVPNFLADRGHLPPLEGIPYLYYCDALEGKDLLGRPLPAAFAVDISAVIEVKTAMLAAHASQREWLRKHHGMDQYLHAMREWGAERGQTYGVAYAEGFRQHLGHGYPQDNLLGRLLGELRD